MSRYKYAGTTKNDPTIYLRRTKLPNGKWVGACGSPGSYDRHIRWGEEPCDACKNAHAARHAKRKGHTTTGKRIPKVAKCGTPGGRNRHMRLGEPLCYPCRLAHAAAVAKYAARRKEKAA